MPIIGTMSFVRKKSRKLASGEKKDYYYEVENKWKDGKVKQKVISYIGTTPYQNRFDIDNEKAQQVSQILFEKDSNPSLVKERLEAIGIPVPLDELREVHLVFNPPPQELLYRYQVIRKMFILFLMKSFAHDVHIVLPFVIRIQELLRLQLDQRGLSLLRNSARCIRIWCFILKQE